jgi:hypothetical protein
MAPATAAGTARASIAAVVATALVAVVISAAAVVGVIVLLVQKVTVRVKNLLRDNHLEIGRLPQRRPFGAETHASGFLTVVAGTMRELARSASDHFRAANASPNWRARFTSSPCR